MAVPVERIRREGERPSLCWSAELVRERLVEAYITERKLPGQRSIGAGGSSWPATPIPSFVDMMHWNIEGDGARDRVWERWAKGRGADAIEISRMDEARDWLRWLRDDDERRCLDAWAKCEAYGIPKSKARRKYGWTKTTFYRKRDIASCRIADRLNVQGVVVR